jgi:Bacterial SH3 domain
MFMRVPAKRNKLIFMLMFFLQTCFFATISYAKDVNLYDQPQNAAKVIGTIDAAQGIIPIFTQPNGEWLKVGDPRNGNVGWVKTSELNATNPPSSFSFSQQVTVDSKGVPRAYPIVRYGTTTNPSNPPANNPQIEEYANQLLPPEPDPKKRQQQINDMNAIYQQEQKTLNGMANILNNIIAPAQKAPGSPAKPVTPSSNPAPQ